MTRPTSPLGRGRQAAAIALCAALVSFAHAQNIELPEGDPARTWKEGDSVDGRWNETDVGPFLASVLNLPGGGVAKGLSIKIGEQNEATVAYDTKTCSFRAAWTGGFLKFDPARYGIVRAPAIDGETVFVGSPKSWSSSNVQFKGLYQAGKRVVLSYGVADTEVLESPWFELPTKGKLPIVTRTLTIGAHTRPLELIVTDDIHDATEIAANESGRRVVFRRNGHFMAAHLLCDDESVRIEPHGTSVIVSIPPNEKSQTIKVLVASEKDNEKELIEGLTAHKKTEPLDSIAKLLEAPVAIWPKWIATGGTLGKGDGPYVIDTVNVPFENPYKALMFTSGLGFLASGDIAVSTMHGDVWLVRGVNDELADVKWKRFATGLCQPLGLTVVDDKIYVLGKDQITRLHDTNGDDEADFYECFNNDGATSLGGHDYAACLETDPDGNFYYIRAHEGVCKVSKDGKTHTSIATGFRNPIGLGVGPDGMVTAAPQEGEWTPSSELIAVKEGGYYGYGGPKVNDARPLGYDAPLCWMPRSQDNSSGGQVWVASDKWGLPRGQMLHLSYGLCTALVVMHETIEDEQGTKVVQGGTVKLPLFFESGACRGRFSPRDGQLYVCGLMGWQTAAAKDGCLQRVRYTGKPLQVPVAMHVKPRGIELTFNQPLDPETAANPDNYFIEQWNYLYAGSYGSKEYKPSDPKKFGRDEVFIDDVKLSNDNRTVTLELEAVAPVMQMGLTYQLKSATGDEVKQTVFSTINAVPAK